MAFMDWIFIFLLIGTLKASSFAHTDGCYDECYAYVFKQLPQILTSNGLDFPDEMKKEFFDCTEREMKRCSWWDFSSLKQTQDSCDSIEGCTEEGEHLKGNKYSFLNCLDDHRPELVKCIGNNILESIQDELNGKPRPENEDLAVCSYMQSLLPCFKKVSIQKCGKDGSELFKKEFGRYVPKHVMASCSL